MATYTPDPNSVARGQNALRYFFNYSVSKFGTDFAYPDFNSFLTAVKAVNGARYVDEGIGDTISLNSMSDSQVKTAMESLARQGGGRIPANMMAWGSALIGQSTQISFLDATSYVVTESASDIVHGAAEVGDAVIATGKSFLAVGPLAILAAALFVLYRYAKEVPVV